MRNFMKMVVLACVIMILGGCAVPDNEYYAPKYVHGERVVCVGEILHYYNLNNNVVFWIDESGYPKPETCKSLPTEKGTVLTKFIITTDKSVKKTVSEEQNEVVQHCEEKIEETKGVKAVSINQHNSFLVE